MNTNPTAQCVCGEPAGTTVLVRWNDGNRRYRYCDACAQDIVANLDGVEILT